MAKYGKSLAQVVIEINGKKQAEQVLKAMQSAAKDLERSIAAAKSELEQLAQSGGGPEYDAKHKEIVGMQQELKQLNKAIGESKKFSQDIGSILDNMSANNVSTLSRTKRSLEALLSSIVPNTKKAQKQMEQLQKAIKMVTDEISRRKGQIVDLDKVMKDLGKATPKQLDDVEKRLQTLLDSVTKNSNAWRKYNKQMRLLQEERSKRTTAQAQDIMGGNYTKTIEGTKQAIEILKKYQQTLNATDTNAIDAVTKSINKMNAELETAVREKAAKVMKSPIGFSPEEINEAIKYTEKLQAATPDGKEWTEYAKQIAEAKKVRDSFADSAKMEIMADQFIHLAKLSEAALANQKKYWEDVFRNAEKGTAEYNLAEGKLQQIKGMEQSRLRSEATTTINNALSGNFNKTNEETREAIKLIEEYKKQLATGNVDAIKEADKAITELNHKIDQAKKSEALDVLGDKDNHSTEQVKQAVDWLTKYRTTLATSTQEWKDLGVEIEKANEYMRSAEGTDKMAVMEQKLLSIGTVSTSALAELKKYWQEVVDGTDKNNTNLAQYEDNLRRVIEEEKARKAVSADAVMTNLDGSNVAQIREAIKATEELRESVKRSDPQWAQYNAQIENAKNYLEKFEIEAKKTAALDVAANLDIASTGEMKQTIDFLIKYRDTLSTLDPEYDTITQALEDTTEALKKFNDSAKMDAMNKQMQNLNNLSKAALTEQKKYWQGVYDSAEKTSQAYKDAENNLMKLDLLERSRTSADATQNITEALSGNWDKTIKETEEAIKLIQEYKNQLRTQSDTVLIDQANEAIEALNRNLGKAKEALMDVSEAERIANEVNIGKFYGTSQDINDAKKSLEEFRKTLSLINDADKIKDIDKALASLSVSAEQGGKNLKDLDEVLDDLSSASMEDLQGAAKRLQEELKKAERNTKEYADTSIKLQRVNKELEKVKKEWEGQESLFIRMTKRLSVYMAAYGSLSAITSYVKDLGKANLQLSDSIADVAKTTGLNAKELAKLGEDIRAIDTRTAQEQLYELAAAAGQLGIKSEAEVAGFVRAANMITVSLNELGTEATTQLMKIATLTGESQDGTEKALLSIGSAINELTASSAAAAGPIVDLMNRMGGIAAQSKITSAQMAAIGATADALGQSVEITGTSMNKFLATLMSNTDQIAYALNMDAKALRSFINEGKTMDAVIAIFERMNDMGGLGALAPVMGDLGSEGARMTQVLAAMAEKVDFLKGQLEISTEAYEKATSIQNEYNVKNENAIAILQRMGNALKEAFVNNVFVDALTVMLRTVYKFFTMLSEGSALAYMLTSSIAGLTAALLANRLAWVQNLQAVTKLYPHLVRLAIWQSLTSAVKSFTLALLATPKAIMNFGRAILQANTWSMLWTNTLKGLSTILKGIGAFLAGNWVTIAIGALVAIGAAIYKAATYISETAKATAKYNKELEEETSKVDTLFNSLTRLNNTEEEHANIINQINQQYGQYLGFMLDEKDSAEKLAAAHQLVNAELRKRMAINLKNTLQGAAANKFAEQQEEIASKISQRVESLRLKVGGEEQAERSVQATEVMNVLNKIISKTISEAIETTKTQENGQTVYSQKLNKIDEETFLQSVKDELSSKFKRIGTNKKGERYVFDAGNLLYTNIEGFVTDALKARVEYQKKVIMAENQANIEVENFIEESLDVRRALNAQIEKEFEIAAKQTADLNKELAIAEADARNFVLGDSSDEAKFARNYKNIAEKQVKDHYKKMIDNANDYIVSVQKMMRDHNSVLTEEEKNALNDRIAFYQKEANRIASQMPGMDPWGKGRNVSDWKEFSDIIANLKTSSPDALAAAFKKLRDETKLISGDVEGFNKMFDLKTPLKNLDEVNTQIFDWLNQLRQELKNRNRTVTGEMLWGNPKEEMDFVLNQIQTYFLKRQAQIRKSYIDGMITSEEMNRRLDDNNKALLDAQIQFQKMMLGQESTFTEMFIPGIENHDLTKLRTEIGILGDEVTDEIEKSLAENENTVAEGAQKIKEAFEKELRAGDPFGTLRESFRSSLDSLKLMSSEYERDILNNLRAKFPELTDEELGGLTEEKMQKRLDFLMELAQSSYTVDRDGLRKMFDSHQEYYAWVDKLDDKQMDVMLAKLQWFYDESLIKQKAYADRLIKAQESAYEQQGLKYDDVAKLQWERQNLINKRAALQSQNTLVSNNPVTDPKERAKIESDIAGHTQAINRLDEQILEAQKKAAEKNKSFRSKQERETKEQMEASISALEAYYNEQEALIRKRGLDLDLTDEEIERQILENSIKRQEDLIQLRKKLLGDESTFDPFANEGYKGAITGNIFFGENKNEEILKRQAEQIKEWGKALTDGMRNQIAKSNIEIQKEAQKLKETIQNILLDKQFVKKAVNEMQASFDQIDFIDESTKEKFNFLWGNTDETERTQEAADARMRILMQYSEDVYSEESKAFKKRLLQDSTFGSTVAKMNEEEYAAFLVLLQQYHDKVISAEKQHADERKRIIDQQWEEEGYQSGYEAADRTIGIAEDNLNTMQNAGAIANEQEFFDQYQQLVLNRVALEQWAYEQKKELYKKNNATQEQFQQLDLDHAKTQQDFQQKLLDNYIARYQKMADVTTSYGNIIGDGFGRMIAGEKDAGKQLIKNLLTETIQMASQFAQRLILQSTFGAQMESIRATQNAAQLSAAYATAMSEVGIEASKMAAIEAIAAGEITAQSMAQPDSIVTWGGAGAARAAVIIGLVAAATAAALALVNSLFPESKASETKNRKLSTGMLTYAEGNYPVLGNDGKVYDAKYEGAGMKTGVYGGGAHFGIFSEKQPEMIVDGKTTQKIILNYPYIYDAITTIAKNGRLKNAMPTFATGDYPAGMKQLAPIAEVDASAGSNEEIIQMRATMDRTNATIDRLSRLLENGISAHLDGLENHKQQKKNERFLKRRGID